jgi:hypothetical protein
VCYEELLEMHSKGTFSMVCENDLIDALPIEINKFYSLKSFSAIEICRFSNLQT